MFGTVTARYSGYLKGLHDNVWSNHRRYTDPNDTLKSRPIRAFFLAAGYGVFYPLANLRFGATLAVLAIVAHFVTAGASTALLTTNYAAMAASAAFTSGAANIWARWEDKQNFNIVTFSNHNGNVYRAPASRVALQTEAVRGHIKGLYAALIPFG